MRRHICGTPPDQCGGAMTTVDKDKVMTHASAKEAFACHRSYLIRLGFVPVGTRELRDPSDGYVRVLTKRSRFGASVRRGKAAESGGGNRMADMHTGGRVVSL